METDINTTKKMNENLFQPSIEPGSVSKVIGWHCPTTLATQLLGYCTRESTSRCKDANSLEHGFLGTVPLFCNTG